MSLTHGIYWKQSININEVLKRNLTVKLNEFAGRNISLIYKWSQKSSCTTFNQRALGFICIKTKCIHIISVKWEHMT